MYNFIHLLSALIRQFLLPNPYINIISNKLYADLFNIIIGGTIIHMCAFILTGCGYTSGINHPASGSFGYLISYCYLTVVITVLGYLISNVILFITIFLIIFGLSCFFCSCYFRKRSSKILKKK